MKATPLAPSLLRKMDAYWHAANYLAVGQIYLFDNPSLKRPLELTDVKHMLLGHWSTSPGQNFIYVHLNRIIKEHDLDMISPPARDTAAPLGSEAFTEPGRCDEHFSIGAPHLFGLRDPHLRKSPFAGRRVFIHGQDTFVVGHEQPRRIYELTNLWGLLHSSCESPASPRRASR